MNLRGLVALTLAAFVAHAAEPEFDLKAALPALLRILPYDVNFDARGSGPFVVLVVSAHGASPGLAREIKDVTVPDIKKRAVRFVTIDFSTEAALQAAIDAHRASALLVVPGIVADTLHSVWDVAQDNQLYALALDAATVEACIPIGVTMDGGKPRILIHEKSSRAVGARFETVVLKLARVIQ